MNTKADPVVVALANLLNLEKEARDAATINELAFVMANKTLLAIPYDVAVVWIAQSRTHGRVAAVSGVSVIERNAPFIRWLGKVFSSRAVAKGNGDVKSLGPSDLPSGIAKSWREWLPPNAVWCPLPGADSQLAGALLLTASQPWSSGDLGTLKRLGDTYGHALVSLQAKRDRRKWINFPGFRSRKAWMIGGAVIAVAMLLAFPIRQSVLAPAAVAGRDLVAVTAPMDGVVERIDVSANEPVKAGTPLFRLDPTTARSRHEVAGMALKVAEADYLKNSQMAFSDLDSKARVALSKAQIDQKKAEASFAATQLERLVVRAPAPGIAVFGDVNDWLGRPVSVGEKVMVVVDPRNVEVDIWLPVADMIDLRQGSDVVVYLNIAPLRPVAASLSSVAYEASMTPEGVLAYRLKASLAGDISLPRIGLRGTAKVYGERVPLIYYLLRRPLSALRQSVGI